MKKRNEVEVSCRNCTAQITWERIGAVQAGTSMEHDDDCVGIELDITPLD